MVVRKTFQNRDAKVSQAPHRHTRYLFEKHHHSYYYSIPCKSRFKHFYAVDICQKFFFLCLNEKGNTEAIFYKATWWFSRTWIRIVDKLRRWTVIISGIPTRFPLVKNGKRTFEQIFCQESKCFQNDRKQVQCTSAMKFSQWFAKFLGLTSAAITEENLN